MTILTTNICKNVITIQYMAPGFEPTTFGTLVSSQNHQTRAPAPRNTLLNRFLCLSQFLYYGHNGLLRVPKVCGSNRFQLILYLNVFSFHNTSCHKPPHISLLLSGSTHLFSHFVRAISSLSFLYARIIIGPNYNAADDKFASIPML